MSYRTIHRLYERYELWVMWALIAAFVVALVLTFLHPTGAVLVFWVGLVVVSAAVGIGKLILRAERSAARKDLQRHVCPGCGAAIKDADTDGSSYCAACGATFERSGALAP